MSSILNDLQLTLESPRWLLFMIPAGLYLFWITRRSWRRPLLQGRLVIAALVRLFVLMLLVLALSKPVLLMRTGNMTVTFLIDVSATSLLDRNNLLDLRDNVMAELTRRGLEGVVKSVLFSETPRVVGPSMLEEALSKEFIGSSNLQLGMELALATMESAHKRVVLFSDGVETEGNLGTTIPRLVQQGVQVSVVPSPGLSSQKEVLLRDIVAPESVFPGQSFTLEVLAESTYETNARLELWIQSRLVREEVVRLQVGKNRFSLAQTITSPGDVFFRVLVRAREDVFSQNNQLSRALVVRKRPRIFYVQESSQTAPFLVDVLQRSQIGVDLRRSEEVPTDPQQLSDYDLLLLIDTPASQFQDAQLQAITSYVSDLGGTVLAIGGENSFGPGGYVGTPVEKILPVKLEPEDKRLALVLLIDQSGSMQGTKIELAKDAAKRAVAALGETNHVGVVGFNADARWIVDLQQVQDGVAIGSTISKITALGGTNLYPALQEAHEELRKTEAELKHIIVLSDGRSPRMNYERLLQVMTDDDKITVSSVAIGTESDQQALSDIAEWGNGRYYFARDATRVPRLFAEETRKAQEYLVEEPFKPVVNLEPEFLRDLGLSTAPDLLGYVATDIRDTAENLLLTPQGDPLLSHWRYGLGQVFAFTSDVKNRWAANWIEWPGFGRFWSRIVFEGSSDKIVAGSGIRVNVYGDQAEIQIDSADVQSGFLQGRRVEFEVREEEVETSLWATSMAPGRFSTLFPVREGSAYVVQFKEAVKPFTTNYSNEFFQSETNRELLELLISETGGSLDPTADEILEISPGSRETAKRYRLWPWLAFLVLVAYLSDIAVRRLVR